MPVVINEFEAVAEAPDRERAAGGGAGSAPEMRPGELRRMLIALAGRRARLRPS
jgi:hypothetical protein